jgi:hypothetical protein
MHQRMRVKEKKLINATTIIFQLIMQCLFYRICFIYDYIRITGIYSSIKKIEETFIISQKKKLS